MDPLSPNLEWLQRRWELPPSAFPAVQRLIEAERDGSTACRLADLPPAWGRAALRPGERGDSPLVLVPTEGSAALQSRHLFDLERRIAGRFVELASRVEASVVTEGLAAALFPGDRSDDRQLAATRAATGRGLAIITGGPGTGKTYTLARILALLVEAGVPPARIRLAAPTGKAADRMKGAVTQSLATLPEPFSRHLHPLSEVAAGSGTLHSLVGYHPGTGRFKHNATNPLPADVLIIDECSMVEVRLWGAVLDALPSHARLVLLGDPNQLESVGQGNVFGELARVATEGNPLVAPAHVHLTEARRFRDRPAILQLARALEECDGESAAALLRSSTDPAAPGGVAWLDRAEGALSMSAMPEAVQVALNRVASAPAPAEALRELNGVCVLTAQRGMFVGAAAVGEMIDAALQERLGERLRNQPIIINRNDPETGLRNGNVGVIHRGEDGNRRAHFPGVHRGVLEVPLAKLPEFSPAWAITIHRSQGSEYDEVVVVLPREESPLATRELLYTAITRARSSVHVIGDLATVRKAAMTSSRRVTLLAEQLAHQV